jgi:ribosomal protein S18 acetylase RimI-like enzyme
MITRLDSRVVNELSEALPRFAYVPLAHLHHLKSDQRMNYWFDEITNSLADETAIGFGSIAANAINGFIIYNDSPWDSKITGRRIGTINHLAAIPDDDANTEIFHALIDKLLQSLVKRGTQCVVCKVQSDEMTAVHALEQRGFLLMDTLVDFVFDFSRTPLEKISLPKRDPELKIRRVARQDLPALMAINEKAFGGYFGRYHADRQLPPGAATKIYAEWVRAALEGWADWMLVAEVNDKIAGYGLWRKPLEIEAKNSLRVAHYDLAAIDPEFRGRGLWTALMLDGMHIAREFAQYIIGPVHVANYPVQYSLENFYWRSSGARHSFHKWLKP